MTPPEKLRLFVAADVPEPRRRWLDGEVEDLKTLPGIRWVPVENQHVTLCFLGSMPSDTLDRVLQIVEEVAGSHAPAAVELGGLGAFPRERRARVLWAGIDDPEGLLGSLSAALGKAAGPLGAAVEDRAYTPHLTLARFKEPRSLTGLLKAPVDPEGPFLVDRVVLYRSRLSPKESRYEAIHEAYLRKQATRSH